MPAHAHPRQHPDVASPTPRPSPARVVVLGGAIAHDEAERLRARLAGHGLAVESGRLETLDDSRGVVALIAIPACPVDAATIARLPDLRVVATPSVGTDHVDLAAAAAAGVAVASAPGYNALEVAEYTLTAVLMLLKDLPTGERLVAERRWDARRTSPRALADATVGLVGFGTIARHVARLLHTLGVHTLVWNRSDIAGRPGAELVEAVPDIADLLARSDVVSLHVQLTDQTRHLVDADFLARMRPGAGLVNTGRGGLVEPTAVVRALRDGRLRGVVLDVLDPEPPDWAGDPLLTAPGVLVTPHQAWLTDGSRHRGFDIAADHVIRVAGV